MNIAFRTDATSQIGTGHFMRCLTLADALKERGAYIKFISRNLPEHFQRTLDTKNMDLVRLENNTENNGADELAHSHWLETSQANDATSTAQAISDRTWNWLIVDHYALDARWESAMRKFTKKVLVIDDIADRKHDCDILLDQNFYVDMETRYVNKVPEHCQLLLGPRYALLRDEFGQLREEVKPRTGPVKRILVFFGGIDAHNYTGQTLDALVQMGNQSLHVDVVIGAQHPNRAEIELTCSTHRFGCHIQTNQIAKLMAAADLAIGAGGSSTWERCNLGLPAMLISIAENQIEIAKALNSIGCCIYLGSANTINAKKIKHEIVSLLKSLDKLEMISLQAYALVDGYGVNRVCQKLSGLE